MNTYTNAMQPKKQARQPVRNPQFRNTAIIAIIVALVAAAALAISTLNRPAAASENHSVVQYSNALELQYARPWLEAQNKSEVVYSNALEMQYAQPWLDAQNKSQVTYSNALEMQYAQPWLDKAQQGIAVTGNAQQVPLNCSSSMEMLYACKFGFDLP